MRTRVGVSLILVFLAIGLFALQQGRGHLTGTVTDPLGLVIPGVTITISGPERRSTATDPQGVFLFKDLPAGSYEVRGELIGFARVTTKVTVTAGRTEQMKVQMAPAGLTEAVAVLASPGKVRVGGRIAQTFDGLFDRNGDAPRRPLAPPRSEPFDTEAYDHIVENGFQQVSADPLSTFSIDVDTASYANVRRFLNDGALPPPGAVRIEELINYFRFDYPQPSGDAPFSITTELAECPWNPAHHIALIGLQAREMDEREPTPRNLVFLIDVSGSMDSPDKLPLVRQSMRMLTSVLTERDRVAIVVYAGASGLVLPSTTGDRKAVIERALGDLEAGGSTNGAAGIRLAYRVARENFIRGSVNRVILATDGDFNVGVTSQDELVRLIEEQRASGIFLSVLGVGTGNLKDSTMEKLADKGNGNYSYLDSLHEARKVLVREAGGTLMTVAKDVKIQVEFNPRTVGAYRLIGYENRLLRNEDFNDDLKDAGEIGAGHSVTALYEIVPAGVKLDAPGIDPLKYQRRPEPSRAASSGELVTIKVRYKAPDGDRSRLLTTVLRNEQRPMTSNAGFASAVAELGMLLRGSKYSSRASYESIASLARRFKGADEDGYRAEFLRLADIASGLRRRGDRGSEESRR